MINIYFNSQLSTNFKSSNYILLFTLITEFDKNHKIPLLLSTKGLSKFYHFLKHFILNYTTILCNVCYHILVQMTHKCTDKIRQIGSIKNQLWAGRYLCTNRPSAAAVGQCRLPVHCRRKQECLEISRFYSDFLFNGTIYR